MSSLLSKGKEEVRYPEMGSGGGGEGLPKEREGGR